MDAVNGGNFAWASLGLGVCRLRIRDPMDPSCANLCSGEEAKAAT